MTSQEITRYLEPVRERIKNYASSIAQRACKKAKKNTWLNLGVKHITYKDEQYYFITKAMPYKKGGCSGTDVVCLAYCMLTRSNGSRYVLQFEVDYSKVLRTYEIHLFQRYRERFLKDSSLDLWTTIHKFFENNDSPGIIQKGTDGYATIVNSGVILSNETLDVLAPIVVYKYKTFITQQMLFDDQDSWNRDGFYKEFITSKLKLFYEGGPEYIEHIDRQMNVSIDSLHAGKV